MKNTIRKLILLLIVVSIMMVPDRVIADISTMPIVLENMTGYIKIDDDIDKNEINNFDLIKNYNNYTKELSDDDINLIIEKVTNGNSLINYSKLIIESKKLKDLRDKERKEEEARKKAIEEAEAAQRAYDATKTDIVHYNPYNLMDKSNLRTSAVQRILKGTRFENLSQTFVTMEDKYGVNLVAVISIAALESGWGNSSRANNGSNNLTGFAVYDSRSKGKQFDSWDQCIEKTFELLATKYLNPNGEYFNGYSSWNVNTLYSKSENWADQINSIALELAQK